MPRDSDFARYRLLAEHVADCVLEVDESLCISWASENSRVLIGRDPASMVGLSVTELILPEDRAGIGRVHRSAQPGDVVVARGRINRSDSEVWVEIVSRPIAPGSGVAGVATLRDVTAEEIAHAGRQRAENSLYSIVEHLQDFVLLSELDGTITWSSPSWQEFKGRQDFPLAELDQDNLRIAKAMISDAAASGHSTAMMTVLDRERRTRQVLWRARAVVGNNGEPIAVQSIGRDVTEEQHLAAAVHKASEQFRLIADNAADVIVRTSVGGIILWVSPSAMRELGYEPDDIIGRRAASFIDPATPGAADLFDYRSSSIAGEGSGLLQVIAHDGSLRWMTYRASPMRESGGTISGRLIVLRNAESDVQYRHTLAASETKFRRVMESAPIGMAYVSPEGNFLDVNDALVALLDRPREQLLTEGWRDVTHPHDLVLMAEHHEALRTGNLPSYRTEKRFIGAHGQVIWGDLSVAAILDEEGTLIGSVAQIIDITNERAAHDELRYRANHDHLTGLANRATFTDFLDSQLRDPGNASHLAVIFADVDHFKEVNDSLGHDAGDLLLQQVAHRLSDAVRDTDVVCRLGGDEFVIALTSISKATEAEVVAAKVFAAMAAPFMLIDDQVVVTLSMGVALANRSSTPQGLLQEADIALYDAKRAGRNCWRLFDLDNHGAESRNPSMVNLLRDALHSDELMVWYQPIVDLADSSVVGYEALSRWVSASDGAIAAEDFITLAETSGLIIELDEQVLRTVLSDLDEGRIHHPVNVNLSAVHVADITAMHRIRDLLLEYPHLSRMLKLEITETAVPRLTEDVIDVLTDIANTGVRFCMDDFGTGFASITTLRHLPISTIKVDGSLIRHIETSHKELTLANGILAMADALGIEVVAEQVETAEQIHVLARDGWRLVQGFYFGPAVPVSELA